MDLVGHQLGIRQHLAEKLDLAGTQRAPMPGPALPAEEEAHQLPHRIQSKAAGHHRIGIEMAVKKPQAGSDIQLGLDVTLAMVAAILGDAGDPVEHQHRR